MEHEHTELDHITLQMEEFANANPGVYAGDSASEDASEETTIFVAEDAPSHTIQ